MVTPASLNKLGNALFDLFLDKISFIVFHVFFIYFLKFVKQDSKYVFLADRMLRISIVLLTYMFAEWDTVILWRPSLHRQLHRRD